MRRIGISASLVALLLVAWPANVVRAEGEYEITFEEVLPIEDLLRAVSKALELPLVWDPKSRGIQGKEVIGGLHFRGDKEEILAALRSLLTFYELVVIPVGEGENRRLVVVDARQSSAILKLKPKYVSLTDDNLSEYESQDGLFVTTTIRTRNLENLRDARNALNRIVTGQNIGNVTEVPAARGFVVTDFAPNVVAIYRLIREMDVPVADSGPESAERVVVFQAFRLKHASALAVAETLNEHFGLMVHAPIPGRPSRPGRTVSRTPQQATPVPPEPGLRIDPDVRLNQVLVTGMRKDVDRVATVIKAVDQALPRSTASVQMVRLENVKAREAAGSLTGLIHGSPGLWTQGAQGPTKPAVHAHQETNSLLVTAAEPALTTLLRVITEMDVPPEQLSETGAARRDPNHLASKLGRKKVRLVLGSEDDTVPVPDALKALAKEAGIRLTLTPWARSRLANQMVRLEVEDLNALAVLRMLLNASGQVDWEELDGVLVVKGQQEKLR